MRHNLYSVILTRAVNSKFLAPYTAVFSNYNMNGVIFLGTAPFFSGVSCRIFSERLLHCMEGRQRGWKCTANPLHSPYTTQ